MAQVGEMSPSAAARERGNGFYKTGIFKKAIEAYQEAASLAPEDPAPLSNLSAVSFEMGRYSDAVGYIRKALSLSASEPDDGPKKQRLYARMIKCLLYTHKVGEAERAFEHLHKSLSVAGVSTETLRTTIEEVKALWDSASQESPLRSQVFDRLPRYKPSLFDIPEYWAVGHDNADGALDLEEIGALSSRQDDIALLLCGSGDARHVFATFINLHAGLKLGNANRIKKMHITASDLKPAALARMIIVLDMLVRYSVMKLTNAPGHGDVLTVVSYLYTCQIVPPFVIEKLQEHIDRLIEVLEAGDDPVPCLYIAPQSRRAIVRAMRQWVHTLSRHYRVSRIRPCLRNVLQVRRMQVERMVGPTETRSKEDEKDFNQLGVIFAKKDFIDRREPGLGALYSAYKAGGATQRKALEDHLDRNWKVNVTLLDPDGEAARTAYYDSAGEPWTVYEPDFTAKLAEADPVEEPKHFLSKNAAFQTSRTVLESMSNFFDAVAVSLVGLGEKLVMEVVVGEMADLLERMRFGALAHRSEAPAEKNKNRDPEAFPNKYDVIHMSNIPDYIGGPLTTFLYARPVLRVHELAVMKFNNLLNPPMFYSHEAFQAEYLLMPKRDEIEGHFNVVREEAFSHSEFDDIFPEMAVMMQAFVSQNYFNWRVSPHKSLPWSQLMKRQQFETWIYGHFLKICLPYPRPLVSDRPVYAPLNLTSLFRLLDRMFDVGYPAHWLSGILASICEGRITTHARAPRNLVVQPKDLARKYPKAEMTVSPWRAEFTTLLSIWRRLLPYGVVAPSGSLVPLHDIREYTVTFPLTKVHWDLLHVPHFMLVLWNTKPGGPEHPPHSMREFLLANKEGDMRAGKTRATVRDVHIITTFKFVTSTRTASFWMREDMIEEIKAEDWKVYIWRTDNWGPVPGLGGVDVSTALQDGQIWSES